MSTRQHLSRIGNAQSPLSQQVLSTPSQYSFNPPLNSYMSGIIGEGAASGFGQVGEGGTGTDFNIGDWPAADTSGL